MTVETDPNQVRVETEPSPPASPEEQQKELKEELQRLNGLVIVEGDFTETTEGTNVILTETFSIRPFSASFRVPLSGNTAKLLPEVKPLHLKVFGDVTSALGNDGLVHVNAIAIF